MTGESAGAMREHGDVTMFPADNVLEFPNLDHRDADLRFGGCGDPTCPTGGTVVGEQ